MDPQDPAGEILTSGLEEKMTWDEVVVWFERQD
jgi:hypothetical protein